MRFFHSQLLRLEYLVNSKMPFADYMSKKLNAMWEEIQWNF